MVECETGSQFTRCRSLDLDAEQEIIKNKARLLKLSEMLGTGLGGLQGDGLFPATNESFDFTPCCNRYSWLH